MTLVRQLPLKKLFHSIPEELLGRYFRQAAKEAPPEIRLVLWTLDSVKDFLSDSRNEEAAALIVEDMRRIHDVSKQSAATVVRAYRAQDLELPAEAGPTELAMRLFLDHPDAFSYAWSRHLFYGSDTKASTVRLNLGPLEVNEAALERVCRVLDDWFRGQAKGPSQVRLFRDGGLAVILVKRGSYVKTVAHWREGQIEVMSFRPASDDVIVYDPVDSQLRIKARLAKDRDKYQQVFLECVAGIDNAEGLVTQVFSLAPLQEGTFDFAGNDTITGIRIVRVVIGYEDDDGTTVEIRSRNVLRSMQRHLKHLPPGAARITEAKFRFDLAPPSEEPTTVAFEIAPPDRTDLAQKRFADIIGDYLVEQGVVLRSLGALPA